VIVTNIVPAAGPESGVMLAIDGTTGSGVGPEGVCVGDGVNVGGTGVFVRVAVAVAVRV
jgi:hypothetical protein